MDTTIEICIINNNKFLFGKFDDKISIKSTYGKSGLHSELVMQT